MKGGSSKGVYDKEVEINVGPQHSSFSVQDLNPGITVGRSSHCYNLRKLISHKYAQRTVAVWTLSLTKGLPR